MFSVLIGVSGTKFVFLLCQLSERRRCHTLPGSLEIRWQISRLNTKFVTFVKQFKIDSKTKDGCRLSSIHMFLQKSNLSNQLYTQCNQSRLDKSNFCIMHRMYNIKNAFTSQHSVWVLYVIQNLYLSRLSPVSYTCYRHVALLMYHHVSSCDIYLKFLPILFMYYWCSNNGHVYINTQKIHT